MRFDTMEQPINKVDMSLDEIIRINRMNSNTCEQPERGRSRSRSRSRSAYRGQQWRLERGQQQQLKDNQPQRSRSRSQDSHRSSSQVPLPFPVPYTRPRCRSLPRQNYTFCNQEQVPAQHMELRSGLGVNIRKHSLGFSTRSTAVFRPKSSLQQLRLARKRVQIAKNILNARHRSYLRQLRQYRYEILDSFPVPLYPLKNLQHLPDSDWMGCAGMAAWSEASCHGLGGRFLQRFPETQHRNILHHRTAMQRVHTEGTLSVTFDNDLAKFKSRTHKDEGGTMPFGFKSSGTATSSPQTIQNPYAEKGTNNDGEYMSANEKQTVVADSVPELVSNSEFPRVIYKPNQSNVIENRMIYRKNAVQTLNERFSNYRLVCL